MKNETNILDGNDLEKFFETGEVPVQENEVREPETIEELFGEEKPAATEPPKQETPKEEESVKKETYYDNLVSEYIEDGDWEDVEIRFSEEDEPVALSELKNVTPEMFRAIKAQMKEYKEEQFKEKYISVEGLDEKTKKLIELKKKGGDITPLIELEAKHVHPLQGLDFEDEQVQEWIVRQKLGSTGLNPKTIDLEIKRLKEELILDVEAKKAKQEVDTKYQSILDEEIAKQEEANRIYQEEQKKFKKSVSEVYKGLNLKESTVKTLVDNATKPDQDGLTNADRLYFAAKENPELFAKINFLLTDEKAYNEFQGIKIKNEVTKDTVKKILTISPKASTTPSVSKKDKLEEFFEQ